MSLGEVLPGVNACLNATSAFFLVGGYLSIRAGARERHKRFMLAAFASSCVFLVSYLVRVALTGTHRFEGPPLLKAVYLAVLFSHMLLAVAIVPLALRTLQLGLLRGDFPSHKKIARWTLPLWVYVSVTGVLVYVMLYHLGSPAPM